MTSSSRFFRFRSKAELGEEHQCIVRLLDEEEEALQYSIPNDAKGQLLIDRVCEALNILEKDYFGLIFVDKGEQRHWLDPVKKIARQMKDGHPPYNFVFRVKFYPADPDQLKEELTRYQLFLQVKRDLLHGRLRCSTDHLETLCAYIVQSELGDYDPMEMEEGYTASFNFVPASLNYPELPITVAQIHNSPTCQGMTPADAETAFLKKAATLETYANDSHPVKDMYGSELFLTLSPHGIAVYQGHGRMQLTTWQQVHKLSTEGKLFYLVTRLDDCPEGRISPAPATPQKKSTLAYRLPTSPANKHLWKTAIEFQSFYMLKDSIEVKKQRSGRSLLRRGTSFRYSGRTYWEAVEHSGSIDRRQPAFTRTPTKLPSRRTSFNSEIVTPVTRLEKEFDGLDNLIHSNPTLQAESQAPDHTMAGGDDKVLPDQLEATALFPVVEAGPNGKANIGGGGDGPEDLAQLIDVAGPWKTAQPEATAETIMESTETVGITDATDDGSAGQEDHATPPGDVKDQAEVGGVWASLRPVLLAVLGLLLLLIITVVLVMEVEWESQAWRDFRAAPEVAELRQTYYQPTRLWVTGTLEGVAQTLLPPVWAAGTYLTSTCQAACTQVTAAWQKIVDEYMAYTSSRKL